MKISLVSTPLLAVCLLLTVSMGSSNGFQHNESVLGSNLVDESRQLLNNDAHQAGLDASDVRPLVIGQKREILTGAVRRHHSMAKRCKSKHHSSSSSSSSGSKKSHGSSSSSSSSSSSGKESSNNDASSSKSSKLDTSSSSSSSKSSGKVTDTSGSGKYERVKSNRGSDFWSSNSWDFWANSDPTHGQVNYQSESSAKSKGLIGIKDGAAFLRVDNKKNGGGSRDSVRFQSKTAYDSGLVIFDVKKMPVGCGTWPALWTTQGSNWPHGGEIDVMEGVGYTAGGKNENQMTVHLGENSPLQLNRRAPEKRASYMGRILQGATNCNQWGSHTGCAFFDSNKNGPSWGNEFNAAGGGIWAMQFGNGGGIKIWFWGRGDKSMPEELSKPSESPKKLDPSSWSTPMANFQSNVIDQKVKKQNIIINITLGGDWAGNVPLDGKCKGQNIWQALQKGSNYDDAEFILNGVDVYCVNGKC